MQISKINVLLGLAAIAFVFSSITALNTLHLNPLTSSAKTIKKSSKAVKPTTSSTYKAGQKISGDEDPRNCPWGTERSPEGIVCSPNPSGAGAGFPAGGSSNNQSNCIYGDYLCGLGEWFNLKMKIN